MRQAAYGADVKGIDEEHNDKKSDRHRPTHIVVIGARENNLKGISVSIPYGKITAVVGVSGSGKSSLVMDTVYAECQRRMEQLNSESSFRPRPQMESMTGCMPVVMISQKEIRANSNSTIGTFSGISHHLRCIYAAIGKRNYSDPSQVSFKLTPATFSFLDPECRCAACNGKGRKYQPDIEKIITRPEKSLLLGASPFLGKLRCDHCGGDGRVKIPYTQDSYGVCPVCHGTRYDKRVENICCDGKSITQILALSVEEAAEFFTGRNDEIAKECTLLVRVGLPYLTLGHSTGALSGGEAARLKIASCLMSANMKNSLFLLDEPTCGLHFSDIDHLIALLYEMIDAGNTVVAIEHNKRFLSAADHVITMGPGAGENGGRVIGELKQQKKINGSRSISNLKINKTINCNENI